MTKLSVNINKIATLRNARGNDFPNVVKFAKEIEGYGGQGITVHPRPDERHITYKDVYDLTKVVTTEFNVEGNPNPKFIDLVLATKPHQVTLVPDAVDAITSNAGWDTIKHKDFLTEVISEFKAAGIRTSIFVDPDKKFIEGAKVVNTDRIELYTEDFARGFSSGNLQAVQPYIESAEKAIELDLGVNAGHDLSLDNIEFFKKEVPGLLEVSIGQALVVESLYYGMENVVNMYLNKLSK
jgi:pyridoxine 5-phosphate synthase